MVVFTVGIQTSVGISAEHSDSPGSVGQRNVRLNLGEDSKSMTILYKGGSLTRQERASVWRACGSGSNRTTCSSPPDLHGCRRTSYSDNGRRI